MSDATLRTSIKNIMDAVPGIGIVNGYDRWVNDDAALRDAFKKDPTDKTAPLYGWEITRDAIPAVLYSSGHKYKVTHNYSIKGYYALKDSAKSELLFQVVIDAVIQAFIDKKISGAEFHPVPIATKIVPYNFAGVLCHHAELRMQVTEVVEMTAAQAAALIKILLAVYLRPELKLLQWKPGAAFVVNDLIMPTAPNGHYYKCTVAGTSGDAEPVLTTGPGDEIADNEITWTEVGMVIAEQAEINL